MAAGDWILPAALIGFVLLSRRATAQGGAGGGFTIPTATAIGLSAGPEVFAGVPYAEQITAIGGTSYQDKPEAWSGLDWEDFLRGY